MMIRLQRMSSSTQGFRVSLGGKAVVCCVHDREKKQVTTEAQVIMLGLEYGVIFDPKIHRIHRCSCCQNLFVDVSDEPMHCTSCRRENVHVLGGPLNEPIGVVDG